MKIKQLNILSYCSLSVFISVILLSESVLASVGQKQVEIAQSTTDEQTAERLFSEGAALGKKGATPNSQIQAIKKFEQSIKLSQKIGNKGLEMYSTVGLGHTYVLLEQEQKHSLLTTKHCL